MSNINNNIQRVLIKEKFFKKNFPQFSLIFFQKAIFSLSFPEFPWDFSKKSIFPGFPGFSRFVWTLLLELSGRTLSL